MTTIQAHRGASKERPENSMAAFRRAVALQAPGIELDVHVLPDNTVVVHHDGRLGRCEEPRNSIYDYRKENIQSFSIGEKFDPSYAEERAPFLEDVLDLVREYGLFLNLEFKKETGFCYPSYIKPVMELLDHYQMQNRCIISSFYHDILKEIRRKYPAYRVGALYGETHGIDMIDYAVQWDFQALHPFWGLVDQDFVCRAHDNHLQVNVWTVDRPEEVRQMIAFGVDTIITNDVAMAKKVLAEYQGGNARALPQDRAYRSATEETPEERT